MIKKGFIVTMNKYNTIIPDGAVYIEESKIINVGKTREIEKAYKADEVIDALNSVVMPGLINSHVHFKTILRRGFGDNLSLEEWLSPSSPGPPIHLATKEELAIAFKLVCLEMIKAGVTCYSSGAGFLEERYASGLRGLHSYLIIDEIGDYRSILQQIREKYSDRFKFALGPWWVPKVPKDILLEVKEIAERHNLKIHMHVAETKWEIREIKRKYGYDGSIEYLYRLGILSPRLIAAHCVHVSSKEIKLMHMNKVGVAHCPVSNAKLGDGIAPLNSFLKAKLTIGLGSDSPATNNCIDMFQEMKFACLLQRATRCNPSVIKAEDVLKMSTIDGARLLGMEDEIGSIERGKKADIIIINLKKPHFYPRTNIILHLVYSARASDVDTSIIDGKIVMRKRRVLTLDENEILEKNSRSIRKCNEEKRATLIYSHNS